MSEIYDVTIRTSCRACAMALAGHAPRLLRAQGIFVRPNEEGASAGPLYIHANARGMFLHDGSSYACPEHGGASDLRGNPKPR